MVKIGYTIDQYGYMTGDVLDNSGIVPNVLVFCPNGFYKPKWNGTAWVEGLTVEEIDEIRNRPPVKTAEQKELDRMKAENEQINLQIIDLFEQLIIKGVL